MKFVYPHGATPIDPDEALGLIPTNILLQSELNEYEQANILEADIWLFRQNLALETIAHPEFIQKIHKKMFAKVWRWAGQFRKSDKNIGCCWTQVPIQTKNLCDDIHFQIMNHSFEIEEIAIRFHHRLVSIHPFPNGNGRHARIVADYLLQANGQDRLTWGKLSRLEISALRERYIEALREADRGDYELLINFAKS